MTKHDYVLVADPNGSAWEFAKKIYDLLQKKTDSFRLVEMTFKEFRDGEVKPQVSENIRGRTCFFIHDSSLRPADWLLRLLLGSAAIASSDPNKITAVLPYLKFARQDRRDAPRVPISARVVADAMEKYLVRAMSVDIHNPAIQGFYDIPLENLHTFLIAIKYMQKNFPDVLDNVTIMSPDSGGADRARKFAQCLGTDDVVIGYKVRKVAGEVASFNVLGDVNGKNVLIVDDMIDSGGTLIEACKCVKAKGAKKVYAYTTHGLFTKGTDALVECFDGIFVTDSLLKEHDHPKMHVVSLAPLFAEALHRITQGDSISALFQGTDWLEE